MAHIESLPADIVLEILHKWLDVPSLCVAPCVCSLWKKLIDKSINELGRKFEIQCYKQFNLQRKPQSIPWSAFYEELDRYSISLDQQPHGWCFFKFSKKQNDQMGPLLDFEFSYIRNSISEMIEATLCLLNETSKEERIVLDGEGPTAYLIIVVVNHSQCVDDLTVEVNFKCENGRREYPSDPILMRVSLLTWTYLLWQSIKVMFNSYSCKEEFKEKCLPESDDLPYDKLGEIQKYLNFFKKKSNRDDFLNVLNSKPHRKAVNTYYPRGGYRGRGRGGSLTITSLK